MTTTNLLEKRKRLEQRKNRLKQLDVSLTMQERKQRTRRLIELGGLVSKAGLDNWNANALLGGLLFLKKQEENSQQLEEWVYMGGSAFARETIKKPDFTIYTHWI